jgi:hypothetical protein
MHQFDCRKWNGSRTAKDAKCRRQDKGGGLGVELGVLGGKKLDLPVPANDVRHHLLFGLDGTRVAAGFCPATAGALGVAG